VRLREKAGIGTFLVGVSRARVARWSLALFAVALAVLAVDRAAGEHPDAAHEALGRVALHEQQLQRVGAADADSVGGYGARGTGTFDALDAAALMGHATPPSRLYFLPS